MPLQHLADHIEESLAFEWGDPDEELPYDTGEGGYQGEVYSTSNVLDHYDIADNGDLLDDVAMAISRKLWCAIDPFGLREDDALTFSWEEFKNAVMHERRYFFSEHLRHRYREEREVQPALVLDAIVAAVFEAGLVDEIPEGRGYYRARIHSPSVEVTDAKALGTPPPKAARFSNRMSPAGISMFYGAVERQTAITEVHDSTKASGWIVTSGMFRLARSFRVCDLTEIHVPSLFCEHSRHLRRRLNFLRRFADDLSRAIEKDGREHIEYVPTQIVTEFLREVDGADRRLDGILYRSSRDGGRCCVLFADHGACGDTGAAGPSTLLLLDATTVAHELQPVPWRRRIGILVGSVWKAGVANLPRFHHRLARSSAGSSETGNPA